MDPDITHTDHESRGEFSIERDGKRVARMNYAREGQRIDILHTEVDPALRGEGAGGRLVGAAVEWARAEHLQILPLCTFAKAVFARTREYNDVLASG